MSKDNPHHYDRLNPIKQDRTPPDKADLGPEDDLLGALERSFDQRRNRNEARRHLDGE